MDEDIRFRYMQLLHMMIGQLSGILAAICAMKAKSSKRAREDDDGDNTNMAEIAKSLKKLVDLFEKTTEELVKQSKNASAEGIWAQLEDIGVEPDLLPRVYMHLIENPDALKAFNGVPVHRRKEMLPHISPYMRTYQTDDFALL